MIIVVSDKLKQQVLQYKIPEKRIYVLRNSIPVDQYIPDRTDQAFRKELRISPETLLIGNIGRLSPEKGQGDFILSVNEILKKKYNVKFVFFGIGPDKEKLKKLVQTKSISNAFIFAGYRTDMQSIYNSLDLVVQSSYTEGMPNVLLESLLMETPVIATDVGGTSEIVKNNNTGSLIKPGDFRSLEIEMERYIKDAEKFRKYAVRGREHVQKNFNFNDRTKKLSELYSSLV